MKNEVNGLTCVVCGKPLTGRQTRFCSDKCTSKLYRQNHREKERERGRKYYQNNKEKVKERARNYNKNHRKERRAYARAYYHKRTHEYKWLSEYKKLYFDDLFKSATDCEYCLYFDTCHGERETCEYK